MLSDLIAPQTVEFPHQEPVSLPQRLQACGKARPCVEASRRQIFIDVASIDASGQQSIALQIQNNALSSSCALGAIRLRNPHIADQHGVSPERTFT